MSVRIHAIAKEIKKTSKEVLKILAGADELKSASSTIDNITAESLIDEFKTNLIVEEPDNPLRLIIIKETSEIKENSTDTSTIPLVKSKEDIEREKRRKRALEAEQLRIIQVYHQMKFRLLITLKLKLKKSSTVPPPPVGKASAPPPPPSSWQSTSSVSSIPVIG